MTIEVRFEVFCEHCRAGFGQRLYLDQSRPHEAAMGAVDAYLDVLEHAGWRTDGKRWWHRECLPPSELDAPITRANLDPLATVVRGPHGTNPLITGDDRARHLAEVRASGCPCRCTWCEGNP